MQKGPNWRINIKWNKKGLDLGNQYPNRTPNSRNQCPNRTRDSRRNQYPNRCPNRTRDSRRNQYYTYKTPTPTIPPPQHHHMYVVENQHVHPLHQQPLPLPPPSPPPSRFIVDAFNHASPFSISYFLTHFHSDHYTGLSPSWSKGLIFCSSITAHLLVQVLAVPKQFVHSLPINQCVVLDGVQVVLIEANHCPGGVFFLFQVPMLKYNV